MILVFSVGLLLLWHHVWSVWLLRGLDNLSWFFLHDWLVLLIWVDLFLHTTKIFKHFHKHASLFLHIRFISVSNEFHINFTVSMLFIFAWQIFLIKMIEILIGNFWFHIWLIRCLSLPHITPVKSFEEWMGLYLVSTISAQSILRISDHFKQNISGMWWKICLFRNGECLFPIQNFLAGDWWFICKERWITNQHFE